MKQRWLKEVDGLNIPFFESTLIADESLTAAGRYAIDRKWRQPGISAAAIVKSLCRASGNR